MSTGFLDDFYDRPRRAVELARAHAASFGHVAIGTAHLLIGLVDAGPGVAELVWKRLSVDAVDLRRQAVQLAHKSPVHECASSMTPEAESALAAARQEAALQDHECVGTEHLLLGLMQQGDATATLLRHVLGVDHTATRLAVLAVLNAYGGSAQPASPAEPEHATPALDTLIAQTRAAKRAAIKTEDYSTAAQLREREKALLARRALARRTGRDGPEDPTTSPSNA